MFGLVPRFLAVVVLATIALGVAAPSVAQDAVTVGDLLADPEAYAGRSVTVEGELIGDYGFRTNGSMWTQLNGDSYSGDPIVEGGALTGANTGIGITMPAELGESLDPPGGYRIRGPIVRVTGVWKYHDPHRQGESYLDVVSLQVAAPGRRLDEPPDWPAMVIGAVLLGGATLLVVSTRRR